jgi:uncharacterized protein YutE (UPF0331/DUF86 family)
MEKRINDKIEEIEQYLDELDSFVPNVFEDYSIDNKTKAACEHYFEKIVEALADLAFLFIKWKGFPSPEDDIAAFFVLAEKNIISKDLATKLKEAKGMRNLISHEYGKIDDELVFEAPNGDIQKNATKFLDAAKKELR